MEVRGCQNNVSWIVSTFLHLSIRSNTFSICFYSHSSSGHLIFLERGRRHINVRINSLFRLGIRCILRKFHPFRKNIDHLSSRGPSVRNNFERKQSSINGIRWEPDDSGGLETACRVTWSGSGEFRSVTYCERTLKGSTKDECFEGRVVRAGNGTCMGVE